MATQVDSFSPGRVEAFRLYRSGRKSMPCQNEQKKHCEADLLSNLHWKADDTIANRLPSRAQKSHLQLLVDSGPSLSQKSANGNNHAAALPLSVLLPLSRTSSPKLTARSPADAFSFAGSDTQQRRQPCLKRRRPVTDVDGPNTAALCCKKRRLRRYLITSRLSQPFSQPASHILNRESAALGDKRFLKLAAVANARRILQLPLPLCTDSSLLPSRLFSPSRTPRAGSTMVPVPHPPCPSEMLRRLAMGNCYRKRVMGEAIPGRKMVGLPIPTQQETYTTHMPPLWSSVPLFTTPPSVSSSDPESAVFHSSVGSSKAAPAETASAPTTIYASFVSQPPEVAPLVNTQEINAYVANDYDSGDMDCAFPASQNGSHYDASDDPDPDDIYSDFSVLFSVPGEESDFEEGFDDYMDELDGIAHLQR